MSETILTSIGLANGTRNTSHTIIKAHSTSWHIRVFSLGVDEKKKFKAMDGGYNLDIFFSVTTQEFLFQTMFDESQMMINQGVGRPVNKHTIKKLFLFRTNGKTPMKH